MRGADDTSGPRAGARVTIFTRSRHVREEDGITTSVKALAEIRRRPWCLLEVALAGALIAWRFVAPTWHPVWFDLLFYLGLYWIYLALFPETKSWTAVTLGLTMLGLGIYLKGQLPHMLLVAELLP